MYKKFVAFSIASALLLICVITFFYKADEKVNSANIQYITSMGRQIEEKCTDISYFKIPEEFDTIFSAYNEIIKQGGFDLTPYKGCRVIRYSYTATDTEDDILINIIRCNGEIISADISSYGSDGYLIPLSIQD